MSSDPQILSLPQNVTVTGCASLLAEIQSALARGSSLVVSAEKLQVADLGLLQLLLSARRTAARDGIQLVVEAPGESVLARLFAQGGFAPEDTAGWLMASRADVGDGTDHQGIAT